MRPLDYNEKADLESRRRVKDLERGVSRNSSVLVSPAVTEAYGVESVPAER